MKLADEDCIYLNEEKFLQKQLTQPHPDKPIGVALLAQKTEKFKKMETIANDTVFEVSENSVDSIQTDQVTQSHMPSERPE